LRFTAAASRTIQTWQLTSTGTITAGKTAQVEVSATLETPKFPANMYAAFGTGGGCGTLNFHGNNTQTDSYDSLAGLVGGNPRYDEWRRKRRHQREPHRGRRRRHLRHLVESPRWRRRLQRRQRECALEQRRRHRQRA
jgi:hypothetical protein